uniref:SRCR domain-containing protein n=1 Tax=Cynoglossus semilaevis TaxID=244447 RepID=A0A3P8W0J9_CYNSE
SLPPQQFWFTDTNEWLTQSVLCFKVRLTGSGSSRCSGRVEVYYSGSWGTVCDDGWNLNAAQVVCRQMGCASALSAPGSAAFGQGSDPILLDNVVCSGTEQTLRNCQHRTIMEHDCSHSEDASVICSGEALSTCHF